MNHLSSHLCSLSFVEKYIQHYSVRSRANFLPLRIYFANYFPSCLSPVWFEQLKELANMTYFITLKNLGQLICQQLDLISHISSPKFDQSKISVRLEFESQREESFLMLVRPQLPVSVRITKLPLTFSKKSRSIIHFNSVFCSSRDNRKEHFIQSPLLISYNHLGLQHTHKTNDHDLDLN